MSAACGALDVIREHLPDHLQCAVQYDRIADEVRDFPHALRVGFEVVLGDEPDLRGLFFATSVEEIKVLGDKCTQWVPAWLESPPSEADLWFETDLACFDSTGQRPNLRNTFVSFPGPVTLDAAGAHLRRESKPALFLSKAARVLTSQAPQTLCVTDIGWFQARREAPVRLNVLLADASIGGIAQLAPDISTQASRLLTSWVTWAKSNMCVVVLCLSDVRTGKLEIEVRPAPRNPKALQALVNVLDAAKLVSVTQAAELMAWQGISEPNLINVSHWPAPLLVATLAVPRDQGFVIERVVSHVKLVYANDGRAQAKAYFGYRPARYSFESGDTQATALTELNGFGGPSP